MSKLGKKLSDAATITVGLGVIGFGLLVTAGFVLAPIAFVVLVIALIIHLL